MHPSEEENEFTGRPDLIKKRARSEMVKRIAIAVGVIYLVLSMAFLTASTIIGYSQRALLIDCTDPQGECAKESAQRTGLLIQQLIKNGENRSQITRDVVRAAAKCQNQNPTPVSDAAMELCINKKMKEKVK